MMQIQIAEGPVQAFVLQAYRHSDTLRLYSCLSLHSPHLRAPSEGLTVASQREETLLCRRSKKSGDHNGC